MKIIKKRGLMVKIVGIDEKNKRLMEQIVRGIMEIKVTQKNPLFLPFLIITYFLIIVGSVFRFVVLA